MIDPDPPTARNLPHDNSLTIRRYTPAMPTREELCLEYLDTLPYEPYPVQERAIYAWYESGTADNNSTGVLVCAPTGTGKTLIAEATLYEALASGQTAYYTTPLIALTDQKFEEIKQAAERWGFDPDDVGLVTGNRSVNPQARIKVVVAEILLNRLLHPEAFDFADVAAVVMDEFHSFNEPERGVVWELSLALLPKHVRLMLLSATVGNAVDFLAWLRNSHGRKLDLVQSDERKVPLDFQWIGDTFLTDHLEEISLAEGDARRTPALVFCFNRQECWTVAEQLKGRTLIDSDTRKELLAVLEDFDWSGGAGPKLKQLLVRGVGVHHAGLLPKQRRRVEELFQRKLLAVCVCTETLAAGINLPARSVVLTSLLKGPPGKKKVVDASNAKQMFGRAGRPQFDDRGYVYAVAHDDDVKIINFQKRLDEIPEDTKDPNLIKARKRLAKKAPKRRTDFQYWSEAQFDALIATPPGNLKSRGALPWRLLAYLLTLSSEVDRLRDFVRRRLMTEPEREVALKSLDKRLVTLHHGGFITLAPAPPERQRDIKNSSNDGNDTADTDDDAAPKEQSVGLFGQLLQEAIENKGETVSASRKESKRPGKAEESATAAARDELPDFNAATPTDRLAGLLVFRGVHPLFGDFLMQHLGKSDITERIQALESLLELPISVGPAIRVPGPDRLPRGPLATEWLDEELLRLSLATTDEISPPPISEQLDVPPHLRKYALTLADKLQLLFVYEYPEARDIRIQPVWVVGPVLEAGNFGTYISSNELAKQEGLIFRHLLRFILLCDECMARTPDGMSETIWRMELEGIRDRLTEICRDVDPQSTDETLSHADDDPLLVEPKQSTSTSNVNGVFVAEDTTAFGDGL